MMKKSKTTDSTLECVVDFIRFLPKMSPKQLAYLQGFTEAIRLNQEGVFDRGETAEDN